jgi:hypothetical protein
LKFKLTKFYNGNIELKYGDTVAILTDKNPSIILTEEEYSSIPEYKQYLITNRFVLAEFVEEESDKVELEEVEPEE